MVSVEVLIFCLMLLALFIVIVLNMLKSLIIGYKDEIIKEIREVKRKLDNIN